MKNSIIKKIGIVALTSFIVLAGCGKEDKETIRVKDVVNTAVYSEDSGTTSKIGESIEIYEPWVSIKEKTGTDKHEVTSDYVVLGIDDENAALESRKKFIDKLAESGYSFFKTDEINGDIYIKGEEAVIIGNLKNDTHITDKDGTEYGILVQYY